MKKYYVENMKDALNMTIFLLEPRATIGNQRVYPLKRKLWLVQWRNLWNLVYPLPTPREWRHIRENFLDPWSPLKIHEYFMKKYVENMKEYEGKCGKYEEISGPEN